MSGGKTVKSNIFEIRKGVDAVDSIFRKLGKIYDESAAVMRGYGKKTEANLFNILADVVDAHHEEGINAILKLNQLTLEAAVESHKKMNAVVNSLDID